MHLFQQDIAEVPTKCVKSILNLDIEARVLFIDFEGRSDGESMKKILQHIKPRQLMLVHGTEKATNLMAAYAKNTRDLGQGKVLVPKLNETIDATKESHIYQVIKILYQSVCIKSHKDSYKHAGLH